VGLREASVDHVEHREMGSGAQFDQAKPEFLAQCLHPA